MFKQIQSEFQQVKIVRHEAFLDAQGIAAKIDMIFEISGEKMFRVKVSEYYGRIKEACLVDKDNGILLKSKKASIRDLLAMKEIDIMPERQRILREQIYTIRHATKIDIDKWPFLKTINTSQK